MKNPFRSRLQIQLTLSQINRLSNQSKLLPEEIEQWYERFILCYPYGYVSFDEFVIYLKQLNICNGNEQHQLSKAVVKQLFSTLNFSKTNQLNFDEFFRFNLLINQESEDTKLKFILSLYDRQKKIYYTQQEVIKILINMFDLLNIPTLDNDLNHRIDRILIFLYSNNRNTKICWNTFCKSVLNQSSLLKLLLSNDFDNESLDGTMTTCL